jgi:hypothetical protein
MKKNYFFSILLLIMCSACARIKPQTLYLKTMNSISFFLSLLIILSCHTKDDAYKKFKTHQNQAIIFKIDSLANNEGAFVYHADYTTLEHDVDYYHPPMPENPNWRDTGVLYYKNNTVFICSNFDKKPFPIFDFNKKMGDTIHTKFCLGQPNKRKCTETVIVDSVFINKAQEKIYKFRLKNMGLLDLDIDGNIGDLILVCTAKEIVGAYEWENYLSIPYIVFHYQGDCYFTKKDSICLQKGIDSLNDYT